MLPGLSSARLAADSDRTFCVTKIGVLVGKSEGPECQKENADVFKNTKFVKQSFPLSVDLISSTNLWQ